MRYFLIRHSKWRSMTTCHTSRKGFLSLLRLSLSFSFIFLRHSPQPRNLSQVHTLHAAIYVSFAFHVAVLSLFFIPSRFVFLATFFYRLFSARRTVSLTTSSYRAMWRREKVVRCLSYDRRRWRWNVPGSYISLNFAETPFNRVWNGTWKSARYVAQAVAR